MTAYKHNVLRYRRLSACHRRAVPGEVIQLGPQRFPGRSCRR